MYSEEHKKYLKKRKIRKLLITLTQLLILILLIATWELLAHYKIINTFISSSPSRIVNTIIDLHNQNNLYHHIWITIYETIISFGLGTILGIIIAILLFDRECVKDNMMSRVFVICMFIVQLILFIMLKFYDGDKITFAIWKFFDKYKIVLVYLGIINFITFIVFALDKIKAISGKRRYKIVTLLGLCFIGGSVGGLLSMYIFKHKTNVNYFTWGIPIIMIMQVIVTIFLTNVM